MGDTGAQFEDPKVSKVFGSEAVVTCDTGMVFKTSQAIADHLGDDCNLAIAFEGQDCRKKTGTVVVFCPSQLCPYMYLAESTACGEAISHILNIQSTTRITEFLVVDKLSVILVKRPKFR